MTDIIKKFQDFFTKLQFFIRIYETKNNIIFWNDRDIMKKVNKIKLEEILQSSSSAFETFAKSIVQSINEKIIAKYSSDNHKVSIIIPNYNNELFIEKCINSIFKVGKKHT